MITKTEIKLRGLGLVTVGEAPLAEAWVCSTVDCAAASLPIGLKLTAAIPIAAEIPMTNCVMRVLGMVASIHDATQARIRKCQPNTCDRGHTSSAL
jgi:hypothetical protein